jgi:hypothetical protein
VSYTSKEILKLVTTDFAPFQLNEERFLLEILRATKGAKIGIDEWHEELDWEALGEAHFLLSYFYERLPVEHHNSAEYRQFFKISEMSFKRNLLTNRLRIELSERIAKALESKGIKAVFMKGQAEVIQAIGDASYRGRRLMYDIDLLCAPEDLDAADRALLSSGGEYSLNQFGKDNSVKDQRTSALEHAAQLIYRFTVAGAPIEVEIHQDVATGRKLHAYPTDFARTLLSRAKSVALNNGSAILVPPLEEMLIHNLAHAASKTNHYFLVWEDNAAYRAVADKLLKTDDRFSFVQLQFDLYQLDFLFKLKNFLEAFENDIDPARVTHMLKQVKDCEIIETYIHLAQTFLPQFKLLESLHSPSKTLISRRRHLVAMEVMRSNSISGTIKKYMRQLKAATRS